MNISDLMLIHFLKAGPNASVQWDVPHVFHLDTCQRQLWVLNEDVSVPTGMQRYAGEAAYEFLLSIACGLQSQVKGETEIFAQIKTARRQYPQADRWLSGLIEDVKFIRSHYVEGLGGQSYGTLVRKSLQLDDDSRLLVVGAGKLASSILPLLSNWPVLLMNRSPDKAAELIQRFPNASLVENMPVKQAVTTVLVCRPMQRQQDQALLNLPGLRQLVHLGAGQDELDRVVSPATVNVSSLDDIFTWQTAWDQLRQAKMLRAQRACCERAKLRCLGSSVTLPHGWEDLAVFA